MSWDAYVTTQLLETGAVAEGAILGEDGTLWAASSGLDVATPYTVNVTQEDGSEQPTEVLECSLIADYARSGERPAAGLRIGKSKYLAGRAATDQDTGILQYNVVSLGGGAGKGGATICKTATAVIIGVWREAEGQNQADCGLTVFKLAAYLAANGM
mmetsp:Transcript_8256/g.31047  ORF Transcript_8256/g.31047 Transcript_8256/m.31047 type:complete len:157 (-) Transcript_8256:296-766(-)